MKNTIKATLLLAGVCTTGLVFGQQNSNDNRNDRQMSNQYDDRRDSNQNRDQNSRYDNRFDSSNDNRQSRQYDQRDLSKAYDEGYRDGMRSQDDRDQSRGRSQNSGRDYDNDRDQDVSGRSDSRGNYKHFTFGVYAGGNTTRFKGETVDGTSLSGRLGYQLGFFVRGGGRIYGQIGGEYQTSSSDFYQSGDGKTIKDITSNIDQRYIQIPAYVGIKVAQSERGVSGIRLAVGAELATPVGVGSNQFKFDKSQFQDVTFNGLGNLGFDVGPLFIDIVYHQGFSNVLKNQAAGSPNSQRQILSANIGIKF